MVRPNLGFLVLLLAFAAAGLAPLAQADGPGVVEVIEGAPRVRRPWLRVEASVEIEAPVARVWAYVGDSTRARDWSVYFDHISPLPGPPDGQVGALRRCFRQPDEQGLRWDERVSGLAPLRVRQLRVFDAVGLPGGKGAESDVWQLYEELGPARTRLTFRTALAEGSGVRARVAFAAGRLRTRDVFQKNLENIRDAIEQGPEYVRVHPWEAP